MKSIYVLFGFLILAFTLNAHARIGGVDGGGGIGVRCNGSSMLEVLDLHESQLAGRKISHHPQTEEEAVQLASTLMVAHYWNPDTIPLADGVKLMADNIVRPIMQGRRFGFSTPAEVAFVGSLPLSADIGSYKVKAGCVLEQIAYYHDGTRTLTISRLGWNALDWLGKAAIVLHELVYWMERQDGLESYILGNGGLLTSERSREFVGKLLSDFGLRSKSHGLPATDIFFCSDTNSPEAEFTYFYVYDDGSGLSAVFNGIHGLSSPFQIRARFAGIELTQILDEQNGSANSAAALAFTDEDHFPSYTVAISKTPGAWPVFDIAHQGVGLGAPQEFRCFPMD